MIRSVLLLLAALFCFGQSSAQTTDQNYPVTAQAFVVAQPNQKLAAYFASNQALTVSLLLKDLTKTSIQAYLRWSIDGPGVHLSSIDGHIPARFITLQRGIMQRLSGLELQSDYFRSDLILAEGLAGSPLRTSLPEGFYTFRVQALEAGTGREVSNWGETYFSITTPLPPVINIPFNGAELSPTNAQKNGAQQPVSIQWMPRHYRLPGHITSYDLLVCKVPDGYEPTEALDACVNPIIDDRGNPGTFYPGNTGIGNTSIGAWEVGARYAVRVTIHEFDENGDPILFANEGRSEVTWFRFGKRCTSPQTVNVREVSPGRIQLTWAPLEGIDTYFVLYRKAGEAAWKKTGTRSPSWVLTDLSPGTYELCVQSECATEPPSSWQVYTLLQEDKPEGSAPQNPFLTRVTTSGKDGKLPSSFGDLLNPVHPDALKIPCASQISKYENCDAGHPVITPSGNIPLTSLQIGDVLTVYDMAVLVTGVNGNNPLSGTGLARLPFFQGNKGETPLTPVEFSGVKAWKAQDGASGGCVYQVDGYFRSRSATSAALASEQSAVLKALQPRTDTSATGSAFTGTLEDALIAYDSLTTLLAANPRLQQELDAVKDAIVKATDDWRQQIKTQYPDTSAGYTRAVTILKSLDSLNRKVTEGALTGAEKAYKDALDDFNHPAPSILPFEPNAPALPGPTLAHLGSCMDKGSGYDPLAAPDPDGLACLGSLKENPYWVYQENGQTWYLTAQANPDGSHTYARASEADWIACGRSPMAPCPAIWQVVTLPEGDTPPSGNPLLPSINQVVASPVGSQTATIRWQGGPAFARYIVKYKGPSGAEQQETVTAPTINLARLTENSNYTFTIEGYDAAGTLLDAYSNGAFSTTTERLATPKNVQPTVQNGATVLLTWDKDITHLSYRLVYTDDLGVEKTVFPTANPTTNNSFTLNGLDSTRTYTYKLTAVGKNTSGGELLSDPAQGAFTTKAPESCEGIISVSHQLSEDLKSVTLSWSPLQGQTATKVAYHQVISTQPTPVWTELAEVSGTTVTIPGLTIDEQYEYKVTPICRATGKFDVAGKESTGMVFTTKQIVKPTVNYTCGATAADRPSNQTPLSKLKVGDYFLIGEFPCEVLELTTTTAPYKGKAAALVPYLGVSNFLMEFEALTLNTDYLVLSGSMRAITDPVLRKKLTDQRNQKDASKENQQKVEEKKYEQPITTVAIKKDDSGKPVLNEKGQPTAIVTLANGTTKEELVTQNTSFVGSDGNQVTISSGGVMTPADGKPVPAPAKSDTDPTKVGDGSLIVRFSKDQGQNYGFDGIENGLGVWGRDNFQLGQTQYYVPVKSIEAGKEDYVSFSQQGSGAVTFSLEVNGTATPLTPEGNRIKLNVPVTGNAALYVKDDQKRVVGKLTILSYPMVTKKVVLVSLNGSSLPNTSTLQTELNQIFAQGVASVNISAANLQTDAYDGSINAERDHYKYSSDMRAIVDEFKEKNTIDNNAVYLFFGTTSTADLAGVMNRGGQFGFIFESSTKTIAHELAHGLFALEHTINDNSNGLAANDLMESTPTGTLLYKYQWQYVQNPPAVWSVFESGDDAEATTLPLLAPNGKLVQSAHKYVVCKTSLAQKDYYTAQGYITGSPLALSLSENADTYYWDKQAQKYRKLISWTNTFPTLGDEMPDATYSAKTASSEYWKVIYNDNNTTTAQRMRGDVVVQTATPRTCATTPVDCSPHDTFDPANAGSVAFLVNSKLADDCVSKLDFATRTAYLAKLKEGFSNNAGGTMDVKKATIRLLQFVALTDHQRQLNDYLANNNLHYWYVDNLSGEDLYAYAAIAGQRVYTFNTNRSDLPTANENRNFSSLSLGLFGNTNIAKIVNNKFEFSTYGKDYEHPNGGTYPLIQLWNNSVAANQYVYLHFEDNFTLSGFNFQKGVNYPVPGVLAYAIFNKNKWNNVQAGAQIGFDVASLAFGVGKLKALYSAANYASNTYKIYRLTKSFMDFGVTIGDVIISNNLTGSFTQAQQDRWNRFCFLYFTASLSAEGAEALIKWKGKTITKSSEFESMMDEVLAAGGGNVLTHVVEADIIALQKVTTTLRSGGVRAINNVKNLVNEGKALVVKPIANSPLAQKMDDYIAAFTNNNSALQGQLGEEIAELMGKEINSTGDVLNIKINNSGNGFDVLSFAPNKTTPTSIGVYEAKPLSGTSVELPNTISGGTQMSNPWVDNNITLMQNHTDLDIQTIGNTMRQNLSKIERYVITVDKDLKQVIILKLDNF